MDNQQETKKIIINKQNKSKKTQKLESIKFWNNYLTSLIFNQKI